MAYNIDYSVWNGTVLGSISLSELKPERLYNIMAVGSTSRNSLVGLITGILESNQQLNSLLGSLNPTVVLAQDSYTFVLNTNSMIVETMMVSSFDLVLFSRYGNRKLSSTVTDLFRYDINTNWSYHRMINYKLLGDVLYNRFYNKWAKLKDTILKQYDYLKPFNITLNEESSDRLTTTKDNTSYVDNSNTHGFNSVAAVPTIGESGSTTREYGRDINYGRDYTRVGNIGNRSLSELTDDERRTAMFILQDTIIKDIVSVFCRNTYAD